MRHGAKLLLRDQFRVTDQSVDKNYFTLKRIVKWLVDNQIL